MKEQGDLESSGQGGGIMRRGEARELAGMLGILVVVVGAGLGVSSMASDASDAAEVREVRDVPAAESPAVTGPGQVAGPAASADPLPKLPVGVSVGV
jgi:hypothetical protein